MQQKYANLKFRIFQFILKFLSQIRALHFFEMMYSCNIEMKKVRGEIKQ